MKEKVKVIIWGLGAMGSGIADVLLNKQGVEIVGVVGRGKKLGTSMYDYVKTERGDKEDVLLGAYDEVITEKAADVVVLCTDSFTKDAFDKIKYTVEKKINVISSAEEMAYPQAQEPELSKEIDKLAKENGVSVLGTGINPGLMMDLLAVALTGCMTDVESILCKRVNSLSPFGPKVMEEQGVGITEEEFKKGVEDGTLSGHVGFKESVYMIADALGWKVNRFEQQMKPILTNIDRKSPYGFAKAGNVAGVNMTGQGYIDDKLKIDMVHPQQIEPEMEGTQTGDYIKIKGTPEVNMAINPEVDGGLGTIAMCVNMIPLIINADAGLKTMIDLPVPRAIMGDFRDFIK
jgi:4-hydroxy-tetrahydrodipicolinate reductase